MPFHGGLDYEEILNMGLDPARVIDFSNNLNPFFPSSDLLAGACAGARDYPDAGYSDLRRAVADAHDTLPECVFAGNGASEIVHLLCRCIPSSGSVLVPVPTFSEYERAAAISSIRTVLCHAGEDLRFNSRSVASEIESCRPDLVFLCNPNNPTGLYLSRSEVEEIVSAAREAVVVVDESYVDFVENKWDSTSLLASENVVILRSLAKFYGLAGIRLGYALSSPRVVSVLNAVRPPWNVNSVACRAAQSIFSLPAAVCDESRRLVLEARASFVQLLEDAGKECLPTDTGFFLVKTPNAGSVRERLLKKGVCVRDCSSFGLPSHIRLAARPRKECEKLLRAWTETDRES